MKEWIWEAVSDQALLSMMQKRKGEENRNTFLLSALVLRAAIQVL